MARHKQQKQSITPTVAAGGDGPSNFGGKLWSWFTRRKQIDWFTLGTTDLKRCLTTVDLTALGIGATLGAGAYVLAGQEAGAISGPAVMLSFLIAAVASLLAGLCYAEFGARVPKAGSAYVYSYVTVGELIAFFIGWNLLLEYVIGTASVASAWSGYLDSLLNGAISRGLKERVPMHISGLGPFPDFVAFGVTMLLTCVVAFGVGESAMINNILTVVNLLVILFVVVCGLFKANFHNWNLSQLEVEALKTSGQVVSTQNVGKGGYFPFGVGGMLTSASSCFYGFVGFDAVATTAEEAKNPQKSIPLAITISLAFIFCAYFGISAVITLMTPYPLLNTAAPLPESFERVGWHFAKYVISIGALCALTTSLFGGMFPMPRIVYAMGCDGLIFKVLAKVYSRTKTPLIATFLTGLFTAVFAMLFSLVDLINMMSIGTLLAYTLVAICVIILRYSPEEFPKRPPAELLNETPAAAMDGAASLRRSGRRGSDSDSDHKPSILSGVVDPPPLQERATRVAMQRQQQLRGPFYWRRIVPIGRGASAYRGSVLPSGHSSTLVNTALGIFTISCFLLSVSIAFLHPVSNYAWIMTGSFIAIVLGTGVVIAMQPKNPQKLAFRVPLAPYLPLLSVFINSYLMISLPGATWVRFVIWLGIGMLLYVCYGIRHSRAPMRGQEMVKELEPLEVRDDGKGGLTTVDRVAEAMGTLGRGFTASPQSANFVYSGGDEQDGAANHEFVMREASGAGGWQSKSFQNLNFGGIANEGFILNERSSAADRNRDDDSKENAL